MRINRQDTNGVKPLLAVGELGYDNYPGDGDIGRVYVGTGSINIPQAKKSEVVTVNGKVDTHVTRVDNPHSVTKSQVGLGSVPNVDTTNASNIVSGTLSADRLAVSGVGTGTYKSVTVDDKGRVTAGSNPTTLAGYGITDADTSAQVTTKINNAVAALVDASPTTLDTLNELAAALGDDPNFATTTATAIGLKADTSYVNTQLALKVEKVPSTDNAVVRFDGTTGAVQNSTILIDDNGNLNITGTGKRITGDFSNATISNRVAFQTSTLNSITVVGVLPNGTATSSFLPMYNNSDNTNSSVMQISARPTTVSIDSIATGTGSVLPMVFTTGGVERLRIDSSTGTVLAVSPTGALGYGTGSGGTVTQLTSKSTDVTLNKPSGQIIMNNSALAAGANVTFALINSLLSAKDTLCMSMEWNVTTNYRVEQAAIGIGSTLIRVTNISGSSLSEALQIKFNVIKGAVS